MDDETVDYFETSKITRARFEELRASDKLPSPSNVALQVMEQLQQDNTCISDIAEVLQGDPALGGRLLELANSALYHQKYPVSSIKEAVSTVGLRSIQQLLLGVSIVSKHRTGGCEGFDYKLFWSQSLAMAVAAEVCCERRFKLSSAEAFTMGLLARIGQLAAASVYPERYAGILARAGSEDPTALMAVEEEVLDMEHLDISCAMLENWGLPVSVVRAVRGIYNVGNASLERDSREYGLAQLFNYAYRLSIYCVSNPEGRPEIAEALPELAADVGFSAEALTDHLVAVEEKWREVSEVLQFPVAQTAGGTGVDIRRKNSVEQLYTQQERGLRILLAGGEQQEQDLLEVMLVKAGHYVISATDGRDALRKILESAPQVVIADIHMPEISGLNLAKMLRENKYGREIYLLLHDAQYSEFSAASAWTAGADAFVGRPIERDTLMAQLSVARRFVRLYDELTEEIHTLNALSAELAQSNRKMEEQSLCDALTGLPNRRYVNNRLKQCVMEASRTAAPLSVIMLDLDHFKAVNDARGHAAGDMVLKTVSEVFQRVCRGSDEVCRLGGEEFLVIARNTNAKDAMVAGNRIREAVNGLTFEEGKQAFQITVSAGVCQLQEGETNIDNLLHFADVALYDAKNSGRNCVRIATDFDRPHTITTELTGSCVNS